MNGWKKILIVIGIAIVLFFAGFGIGYWRSNQVGDIDSQARITELKRLNSELEAGDIQFRTDIERAEGKLRDFLSGTAERNRRATEILGRAESEIDSADSSIDRAILSVNRLSKAIEILLDDN